VSKEVLDQILNLLTGLSSKEVGTIHKRTRPIQKKLSPTEAARSRQEKYRQDIRNGEVLHHKTVY